MTDSSQQMDRKEIFDRLAKYLGLKEREIERLRDIVLIAAIRPYEITDKKIWQIFTNGYRFQRIPDVHTTRRMLILAPWTMLIGVPADDEARRWLESSDWPDRIKDGMLFAPYGDISVFTGRDPEKAWYTVGKYWVKDLVWTFVGSQGLYLEPYLYEHILENYPTIKQVVELMENGYVVPVSYPHSTIDYSRETYFVRILSELDKMGNDRLLTKDEKARSRLDLYRHLYLGEWNLRDVVRNH